MTTITIELRELADKFSEGWHDGIKIDACDVMLLTNAADEIERLRATLAAPATAKARKPRLNSAAFMAALISAAELRKVSMRDVSLATGVSETTLSRMRRGERACDAASFSALSAWAGLNPQDFYFPSTKPATAPVPAWHDAPTVPGLWITTDGQSRPAHWLVCRVIDADHEASQSAKDERWYGPIPADVK